MHYGVWNDCEWLYPDTTITDEAAKAASLDAPCGGHAGFQVLCEAADELRSGTAHTAEINIVWQGESLPTQLFELLPVTVNENTAPGLMTTTDYDACKDYVTRRAPFSVYDALRPLGDAADFSQPSSGCAGNSTLPTSVALPQDGSPLAFYVTVEPTATTTPGVYSGSVAVRVVGQEPSTPVREVCVAFTCHVWAAVVPSPAESSFAMLNFFDYDGPVRQHHLPKGSEEYWSLFRTYVRAQLAMRCTHILLPAGEAIYTDGVLTGFDFSLAERAGQLAVQEGAPYLCGGHIAHWHEWNESEYYLGWSDTTGVTTFEGYLQLRRYFSAWAAVVERNGWSACMTQALADEPQTQNGNTYRILAAICRKFLPDVPIVEAVETANLGGGVDIFVPKLDTLEKEKTAFAALQQAGETLWGYTCAFPAGRALNRSMDLPLTASRAVLWLCSRYGLTGFLHWGFNYYIGQDIWNSSCCPHKGALLPAGDAHIVYPPLSECEEGVWRSMRFEAQRGGAEDCALLAQLYTQDEAAAQALTQSVCTDSRTYTPDGASLLTARRTLLERLSMG